MSSDSLEATAAAVNTITVTTDDLAPDDRLITNHLVNLDQSVPENGIEGIHQALNTDSAVFTDTTTVATCEQLLLSDDIVCSDVINSDSVITINQIGAHVADNHVDTSELVTSTTIDENVLSSLATDRLNIDAISLLQQLQPGEMMVSTEDDHDSIPLILDDVTFLNIETTEENMQVISLTEFDPSIIQTQVRY